MINTLRWLLTSFALLVIGGCAEQSRVVFSSDQEDRIAQEVLIAQENFAESYILAQVLGFLAQSEGHKPMISKRFGAFSEIRKRMERSQSDRVDANINYMGDVLASYGVEANALEEELNKDGIEMVKLGFENGYELAMRTDLARRHNIDRCADLKQVTGEFRVAVTKAFERNEWETLAGKFAGGELDLKTVVMDHAMSYEALRNDAVELVIAYSTDPELEEFRDQITVLKDPDDSFFPLQYDALLLFRSDLREGLKTVWKNNLKELTSRQVANLNMQLKQLEDGDETVIAAKQVSRMLKKNRSTHLLWGFVIAGVTLISIVVVSRRFRSHDAQST